MYKNVCMKRQLGRILISTLMALVLLVSQFYVVPAANAATLKVLPELNYCESAADLNYWDNVGFTSVTLSNTWKGNSRSSNYSIKLSAANVSVWPVVRSIYGNNYSHDKKWNLYTMFQVDLYNPGSTDLPLQIKFKDVELNKEYVRSLTLRAGKNINIELFLKELEDAGLDLGGISWWEVQVQQTGTYDLYIDNAGLIEPYKGSAIYRYNMVNTRKDSDYDKNTVAAALQGLVNRTGPRLMIRPDNNGVDDLWASVFRESGSWLAGYKFLELTTFSDLINTFANEIKGVIIWDTNVPATLNVATTMAGQTRAIPVKYDTTAGSPYDLLVVQKGKPVIKDLRNMFTGSGTIPETNIASSGSKKNDAYRWAKYHYIDTGLCNLTVFSQIEDGYVFPSNPDDHKFVTDRDITTRLGGFAFDLNPWPGDISNDEPSQPAGVDYETFTSLLSTAWSKLNEEKLIKVYGYVNWWHKYSDKNPGPGFQELPSEYQNIYTVSGAHATLLANECVANTSFYMNAPEIDLLAQNPPNNPVQLQNKTYLLVLKGDYDGIYGNWGNWRWDGDTRRNAYDRTLPVTWMYQPSVSDYLPELFRHYYATKSPLDYFGASVDGMSYMFPSQGSSSSNFLNLWTEEGKRLYSRLGMKIAPFNSDAYAPPSAALDAFSKFSVDLYAYNRVREPGWHDDGPETISGQLVGGSNGMPVINLKTNRDTSINEALADIKYWVDTLWGGIPTNHPNFFIVRDAVNGVDFLEELVATMKSTYPDYNWEAVDPYTFSRLYRESLGGSNTYRYSWIENNIPQKAVAGSAQNFQVKVRNDGWESFLSNSYYLGFKLYNSSGTLVSESWSPFPRDIPCGTAENIQCNMTMPTTTGSYKLKVDIVHNNVGWFETFKNVPLERTINIVSSIDELPGNFLVTGPSLGSLYEDNKPTFLWHKSEGATSYNLIVDNDSNFSSPVINTVVAGTTFTPTSGLTNGVKYYWKVTAANANGSTNNMNGNMEFTVNSGSSSFSKAINCGGSQFTDGSSVVWSADQSYTTGGSGYMGQTSTVINTQSAIADTSDDVIFQNQRSENGGLTYRFDTSTNGTFSLKTRFAEIEKTAAGQRVMKMFVNNRLVLSNYDIFGEVGANRAQDKDFTVTTGNNSLGVYLERVQGSVILAGIKLTQLSKEVFVDLSSAFNRDGISWDSNRNNGGMGTGNITLPAEELTQNVVTPTIRYQLGSFTDGVNNVVYGNGQTINLPQGNQSSVHLLALASDGNQSGTFRITYTDDSYEDTTLTITDMWSANSNQLLHLNHCHLSNTSSNRDWIQGTRIVDYTLNTNRSKTIKSIKLPNNDKINVLAMTMM